MKTNKFLIASVGLVFAFNVFAQKGIETNTKYGSGEDSINCIKNLSLYRSYVQQNNFNDALPFWRKVFYECPLASENLYLDGVKIFKFFISNSKDNALTEAYIDTLALVYDQRIKYFKKEGPTIGRKAVDLYSYSINNMDRMMIVYKDLKKSIDLMGNKSASASISVFFPASVALFKSQKLVAADVVNAYTISLDVISANAAGEEWDKVKAIIDQSASTSGAFTQEALEQLFQPKFNANPNDLALLRTISGVFKATGFEKSMLYFNAIENLHKIEPSFESAEMVGDYANFNKQFDKASEYYKQAISLSIDDKKSAFLYLKLADITFRHLNNSIMARTYAQKSFELDNTNGKPLMLIANIYASTTSCNADELQKKSVFWLAVDYYAKARNADPSLAAEANANIASYSRYFPDKETVFFHGYDEGKVYKVECWINESTIVRVRN